MDSGTFRNGALGDIVPHGSKECNTRNSREVTNPSTTLAQARLVLMGSGALVLLNLSPNNCAVYSPPIMFSRAFRNGAIGDVVPHGSKVMRFSSLDSF
ncbi:hypothetical protein YC2023_033399 [Brassica napus]